MAHYVVGDLQGCLDPLICLLERVEFDPLSDVLWCVGDIVNRGPKSLATLRYVHDLGDAARIVLGNHDLHLLAILFGGHKPHGSDTFDEILAADDAESLGHWMRRQPLYVETRVGDRRVVMTHAGVPHIWPIDEAAGYAREVETVLRGEGYVDYLTRLYGNEPPVWNAALDGMDRHRVITNYFTRMRFIAADGTLEFKSKGSLDDIPAGFAPWFSFARDDAAELVFGHWASINGATERDDRVGLDTGCVWGRSMTCYRLEDRALFTCDCP